MAKNLVDKKYYPVIWVALVFASLIFNAYSIYLSFADMESVTRANVIVGVLRSVFIEGAIPAVWCFVLALVTYSIGARRYIAAVPRNDFVYIVMIFTAIARVICGIIEIFCILLPSMYVFTSAFLDLVVLTVAYSVMFFFVFDKQYKLNPVERYNSFSLWASVYLVLIGISVVLLNAVYLVVFEDAELLALINEALAEVSNYVLVKDSLQVAASATALSLYAAIVVAAVVIGEVMKRKAKNYVAPETRGDYFDANPNRPYDMRGDVGDTYSDFDDPYKSNLDRNPYRSEGDNVSGDDKNDKNGKDGNVFDEFDI